MDILKAFSLLGDEYTVNIQGTVENPLFKANDIGEILGLTQIRKNLLDFSSEEKVGILIPSLGGNQETSFLTEIGLYKIIMRSRKPIANKFQSWVINVIKEIRLTGMYKLKQENEIDKKLEKQRGELRLHQTLMKAYHRKNIIYICKLKDDETINGYFLIKIGSTHDIKSRVSNLNTTYDISHSALLIDAFQCENYIQIENILHSHDDVQHLKYHETIKLDGTESRETYRVNDELLQYLQQLIQKIQSVNVYSNEAKIAKYNYKRALIELEREKLQLQFKENVILPVQNTIKEDVAMSESDASDTDEEEEEEPPPPEIFSLNYIKKRTNGIYVPKIYQYSPDDLVNPIRIFDSPSEAERTLTNVSQAALKRASAENVIYKDFRWLYVNRVDGPPLQLEPTIEKKHSSAEIRFIAMIDVHKTKILAVYASQKEAVTARNMKCNSFTRAIKQQSLSSGHYWNFFDDCSEEMQQEYLKTNNLPDKLASPSGIHIQKIDPVSRQIVCVYNSKKDIVKKYQMSYSKINQLICDNTDEIYQGFIWKLDLNSS